ncbi:hypothetical protein RJ640_003425 [Escallonia rubra]|uniref:Retrotransposon gag domain-containing protein n=1 Tax=Escallonia rubra TaxID=112253 RepID=A0AA88UTY9_9ASTE|nr:hypothetical protein RJ640_003425 [Escallonia rubra]
MMSIITAQERRFDQNFQEMMESMQQMFAAVNTRLDNVSGNRERGEHFSKIPPCSDKNHDATSGSSSGTTGICHPKVVKMDFPRFDGEADPISWTCRASQIFYYHQTPEEERVPLASWNLEGDAQLWYQLLKEERGEHRITWKVFKDEVFERFGPTRYQDFFGDLTKLQQSGSWSEDEDNANEEMEIEPNEADEVPEIFIHAMCGARVPQTMRVQGKMGQRRRWIAKKIGLAPNCEGEFEVAVASGEKLCNPGRCKGVCMMLQWVHLKVDLYLLPLEGCDAVLGAQWLSTLGPITWDFSKLEMSFKVNGKEVMLQGLIPGDDRVVNAKEYSSKKNNGIKSEPFHLARESVLGDTDSPHRIT